MVHSPFLLDKLLLVQDGTSIYTSTLSSRLLSKVRRASPKRSCHAHGGLITNLSIHDWNPELKSPKKFFLRFYPWLTSPECSSRLESPFRA